MASFFRNYTIKRSRKLIRNVLVVITCLILGLVVVEIVIDLRTSSLTLLLPALFANLVLVLLASFTRIRLVFVTTLQILIVVGILEVHFFVDPTAFHTLVYWMPFFPIMALLMQGVKRSLIWFVLMAVLIVGNGIYGMYHLEAAGYSKDLYYAPFIGGGLIFGASVFFGMFSIYRALGKVTEKLSARKSEIEMLNKELQELNELLNEKIKTSGKKLESQDDLLNRISHYHSHLIEAPLANIQHLVKTIKTLGSAQHLIDMLDQETGKLKEVLDNARNMTKEDS